MTMPVGLEPSVRLSWRRRIAARFAVASASVLMRLPPRRLRQVLGVLSRRAAPATKDQALAARNAVVSVSVRCAGQGCLQRSVATVLLCRLGGTWPDWCTGVLTDPFRAHAWVEAEGIPVGEGTGMPPFRKLITVSVRR
ncbi:lasso peptide biosynthesis B2 protein [Actinomadura rudentiformis]|uniref:Lasso peptide biosynthesis B2 protein n=1 Tax=Actinomadura rudentiformis TaxID=359158 RepID=A0A6H9Z9T0_9ACTN|nr:lasso peptide biosynthesis B2 protein [Actinomadura rudentiformis]KAB2352445.1 lasso peptide biosynthesis B2 protein [Actinomadura rudentiformis]